jgi:hypothetical protein
MRNRQILNTADNWLLVVVVVVGALVLLKVLGAVVGFVWLVAKLAILTAVVAGVWRAVSGRRHELGGRRRDRELYR